MCRTTTISNNLNENIKAQTKCIQAAMHSAVVNNFTAKYLTGCPPPKKKSRRED